MIAKTKAGIACGLMYVAATFFLSKPERMAKIASDFELRAQPNTLENLKRGFSDILRDVSDADELHYLVQLPRPCLKHKFGMEVGLSVVL